MKTTKLLTAFIAVSLISICKVYSQCSNITVNGSTQNPSSVCSPVVFNMEAKYQFLIPVDTSLVQILFRWNDGTGATTLVSGNWNSALDSIWADASHLYPPTDECSRTAEAILVYDGELCMSSGYQEQTFATWGTDEENSGVLSTEPVVYYVCEGEDIVDVIFDDNSTFNCNINIEPDRPNRYFRWVQFFYNTYSQAGGRIPDVTVRDNNGVVHQMTDNSGTFVNELHGPIIEIPIPADGPNQSSYPISAPAGGVAGDIFEITLRNWNVCNPYDNNPNDGILPVDIVNGDNPPITTTARIEIIAPPPLTVPALFEFCTGDNIILNATAGGSEVRWYKDAGLDTLVYTGNNYNPTLSPYPINPDTPGNYTYYVTSNEGICESAPSTVNLNIYQTPANANAGLDQTICNNTITLSGNTPTAGTGIWTTPGTATIADPTNPVTQVTNLQLGANTFTWTITNGPCSTLDNVIIYSDQQPSPADAGIDQELCDANPIALNATPPDNNGSGSWIFINGSGTISDSTNPAALVTAINHGANSLIWRVFSQYGACPVTTDTVNILADLSPGIADAGNLTLLCETNRLELEGNSPQNNGIGRWNVFSGTGAISDNTNPNAVVSNLSYGINKLTWTLESLYGICPANTDTLIIQRFQTPGQSNAGLDQAFCLVNQYSLNANTPAVGLGSWTVIENPSGTSPTFSPNNSDPHALFSVLSGNEGLYMLEWRMANGTCISSDTVIIDFGIPVPQANAGPDTVTCGYIYEMQGNTLPIGRSTWSVISGPESVSFSPDIFTPDAQATFAQGAEGLYNFEWRFSSGSCPETFDNVNITIRKAPIPPILSTIQSCGPDSFTIDISTTDPDQIVNWYDSEFSPTPIFNGSIYETGLIASTQDFFVSIIDTLTLCETPRVEQLITIDEIPPLPELFGDTLCGPGLADLTGFSPAPGDRVFWYDNLNNNVPFDTGFSISVNPVLSTTYFYARSNSSTSGCTSDPDSVEVVVWGSVQPPVVYHDSSCYPSSFILHADKSDNDNILFWYNNSGSLVAIFDTLVTAILDTSTSFFVAEYDPITQCTSQQSELRVLINTPPSMPTLADTFSCGAASFTLVPEYDAQITDYRWYHDSLNPTPFHTGDSLITPLLLANESFWVSGYNRFTGCEGQRKEVQIDIYPSPAAIDIYGPTLVLVDQTNVVFFTLYGQPGSTYRWNIPPEIVIEENMNDFVRLGFPNLGTYTISVYETTVDDCIGEPVYHSITVVEDSIAVDIGDIDQSACTAEPYEIKPWLFGGTPPYIYRWSGDSEYLSSTETLFTNFIPPGTGTYTLFLEVADVNLKIAYDTVHITVYESPETQITNTDTIACVDDDYQIQTLSSGSEPFTHFWSGPIHNLNNYSIANPIYTPRQSDTAKFHYILRDANGCRAYDSITLISDKPIADFNVLTQPGCSPLMVDFENTSIGAVRYNWYFGDNSQTTAESPSHEYDNPSPEIRYIEVKMIAHSILGCADEKMNYVTIWPNPDAEITALPQNSCNPANVMLVSTPGNSVYYWNFGDGSTDTSTSRFNTFHTYTNTSLSDQTFTTSVITQSSLNCFDTATVDITVYATPDARFSIDPEESIVPESIFSLQNLTEGTWNYYWDFGDGRGSTLEEPGEVEYEEPGIYTVSLRASGEYCSDSSNMLIRLRPAPPIAHFKGADNGCTPHTITLINESSYADSYLWDFGDGNISTAKNPTYTYYEPGIYKIRLTVSGMGGTSTFSDTTRAYILPNSFFDLAPRYVYVNDEPVNYFNLSDHGDVFEWDFGDGTTSEDLNPKHVYKEEGTYDVTLKVWTDNGCFDLYIMENSVFVEPSGMVEYPNAFRPNSPLEENRIFMPGIIDHVENYHLMIFNRWGELIFESFDQEVGWDGIYQGKIVKQDVYIWRVKGTYTDGKGFNKTGNVTLLY